LEAGGKIHLSVEGQKVKGQKEGWKKYLRRGLGLW